MSNQPQLFDKIKWFLLDNLPTIFIILVVIFGMILTAQSCRSIIMEKAKSTATNVIKYTEKFLLGPIAVLTLIATGQEVYNIYSIGTVNLADLLLLFIYTEVLGMIGVFTQVIEYQSRCLCLLL